MSLSGNTCLLTTEAMLQEPPGIPKGLPKLSFGNGYRLMPCKTRLTFPRELSRYARLRLPPPCVTTQDFAPQPCPLPLPRLPLLSSGRCFGSRPPIVVLDLSLAEVARRCGSQSDCACGLSSWATSGDSSRGNSLTPSQQTQTKETSYRITKQ